jgi:hypothetical protein
MGAIAMVSHKRRREFEQRRTEELKEAYAQLQQKSKVIYRRLYELSKGGSQENLIPELVSLLRYARTQTKNIRQSIMDKGYKDHSHGETYVDGDVATYLGEDIVDLARANTVNPQSVWQALSEQFPDVNFQVEWTDAAALVSATIRFHHILGVIEGLELAGIKFPEVDPDLD